MPEIYSVTVFADGIKYAVYFFGTFSGHFHPYTPTDPLQIDEIHVGIEKHGRTVYYQGWYSDTPKGPRLDKLLKYRLYKGPIEIDIKLSNLPGVYYHRIENVNRVWKIREPLPPEAVVQQQNYFRYVVNKDGEVEFAYRIYATLMFSFIYTYKQNGALDKVKDIVHDFPEKIPID